MVKESNIGKNVIYNLIKTMSSIIFPLITVPYITRVLHVENLGKINVGNSIVGYIGLIASLGITTYAIRECSQVRDNKRELENISSQLISINIFSTIIAYIVLAFLLLYWKSIKGYELLILIQSSTIIFGTLGADWMNSAMEDFKFIAIRSFVIQIISILCMFVFVHKPDDYLIYVIISVIAQSGANIINIIYRRKYCKMGITFKIDWKKHIKPIFLLFALILAQTIFVNVDMTMIGIMKGDKAAGLYATSTKIYTMVNQVIASVAWVVMPRLSNLFHSKNYSEINRTLKYTANIVFVLGIPSVIGLNVIAPEIIAVIAGKSYLPATASLRILTVALAFSLLGGFVGNIILLPSGKENICLIVCVISAIVNFILNIILIPEYGINAAAFTTAVSQILSFGISIFFVDKNIKLKHLWRVAVGPLMGGVAIGIIGIVVKIIICNIYVRTAIIISCSVLVYGLILLLFNNELAITWKEKFFHFLNEKKVK